MPHFDSFPSEEALIAYIQDEANKLWKLHKGLCSPLVIALADAATQAEYRS